jgi:hypothetical protein
MLAMKNLLALALVVFWRAPLVSQEQKAELGLPALHTIKTATLSPAYSCRSPKEFQAGYENTALFLSKYSTKRNSPDLLFNGACGSKDYFEGATAGDDMSLIADLGEVPLEEVSASKAFNFKRVHSFDLYSRFAEEAPVEARHTYVVLISKRDLRGLFMFSVRSYVPNSRVDLQFAVKEYQVLNVREQSAGFDWESGNRTLRDRERPCDIPAPVPARASELK